MKSKESRYLEFDFKIEPLQPAGEILIAELAERGFESFVENNQGVIAYINEDDYVDDILSEIFLFENDEFNITWSSKIVAQQNWNAEWERSFQPIKIDDRCLVRAPFHSKEDTTYDIVIEPKMSFGTGHHETTFMMLQHLLVEDLSGKKVLDMGCGTGILAILADMRGAKAVDAIDIDVWCYNNSVENVARNNCKNIAVYQGDASLLKNKKYDCIIANINRNILLDDISAYANCLNAEGILFLSGFYKEDLNAISSKCEAHRLQFEKKIEKNNWVAAKYVF
ncbi:MAG: 50S ribosomal protein L11 methyltransferase [Croceitalea sp.]|nr:50S ribosomal protein L11 methyltransferase [Croceitalea sp.]